MVNQELLNYIRLQQAQGFTYSQIKSFLKKNGYSEADIESHFKELVPKHDPIKPMYLIIGGIALLVLVGIVVFVSWYFSQPVCGNGVLEEGETPETCCIDAGCFGDESCENNQCVAPVCGDCQYLRGSECYDYECCEDSQCGDGYKCQDNRCREFLCGYCQFVDGHVCSSYECCEDAQCGDGENCVNNECKNLGCGRCQYVEAGLCVNYECCLSSDCDDGDPNTRNTCVEGGTLNAYCEYTSLTNTTA